jgi:signal transduction histidine kinase
MSARWLGVGSAAPAPKGEDLLDIVRTLPDVIFRCEKRADGAIVWTLNEGRLAEEFHLTTRDVYGKTLEQMFPPDAVERLRPHFERAFEGHPEEFVNELGGRYFKHFPQPVRGPDGSVKAVVGFITEVTGLVKAEATIKSLNEQLFSRLIDLQKANDELDQVNRDLAAFAHTVSHDLQTPLSVIDNMAFMLQRKHGPDLAPEARGQVDKIRAMVVRMSRLILAILQFSRAGSRAVRRESVDLTAVCREAAAMLQERDPRRVVDWRFQPGMRVRGDPELVHVLMENLLGNAWKYTAKKASARVEVRMRGAEGVVEVEDDGVGFSPEEVGKLFTPFHRLGNAAQFEGSGIGLATVQRIVERHGGQVWAEGHPGQGALFSFTLGRATDGVDPSPSGPQAS